MPGPFPGMDPYLEGGADWTDRHNNLAGEIRRLLNKLLPKPFYAINERRVVLASRDAGGGRRPDSGVYEVPGGPAGARAGLLPSVRVTPAVPVVVAEAADELELAYVEVRARDEEDPLVTAVEILSPTSKERSRSRRAHVAKQREYAARGVSVVEIDLLRSGQRSPIGRRAVALLERQGRPGDYLTLVRRGLFRAGETLAFPVRLCEPLPVVPVPLAEGVADVPLDLQHCFNEMYDGGPYADIVDYDATPAPPLPDGYHAWAADRVAAWREGREPTVPPPGDAVSGGDA